MEIPSLNQSTTIPQLLQLHYERKSDQPLYVFAEEGKQQVTAIQYLEFVRASHRAAHLIRPNRSGLSGQVVAIMALVDTIVYTAVVAGLIEAGLIPLLISPRNTPSAVINLIQKSGATRLLTTNHTLHDLLDRIKAEMMSLRDPLYDFVFEEVPSLQELFPKLGKEILEDPFEAYPPSSKYPGPDDCAIYLHSSGSTGLPKAIPLTHSIILKCWGTGATSTVFHQHGLRVGGMSLPTFHAIGLWIQLFIPLHTGITVGVYPPVVRKLQDTPFMTTPDSVIEHLRRTRCDSCMAIPSMIKIWAQEPSHINVLRSLKVLMFGGGSLPLASGDNLVSKGVHLRALYGGTEIGIPVTWTLEDSDEDWAWHRFGDNVNIRWFAQGDGSFELQVLNSDTYPPAVKNLRDINGYATSDLWWPHPSKDGLWSIGGRVDDVIIHSSGEKTVPGLFEEVLGESPIIIGCIMFGQQRDQPGVLVEPSPENVIDSNDLAQVSKFRNMIWPVVVKANEIVPAFSRVFKEMILITSPTKALPRSGKGTVLRKAACKEYAKEIDQIYDAVELNITNSSVGPLSIWNITTVQHWLTEQVEELCYHTVDPSSNLFDHGFDSLCATILRVRIINTLRIGSKSAFFTADIGAIANNMVYINPTIASLAGTIMELIHGTNQTLLHPSHEEVIQEMIALYSQGLNSLFSPTSDASVSSETVVLLTGSTGNLGAQILADLLKDKAVSYVYTLNRPSATKSVQQRHQERFKDRDFDLNLLSSDKLVTLEGETFHRQLGLPDAVYNKLQRCLTMVIHTAWKLDFNLPLSSFEPLVHGTRNLIDLACSSYYASSLRFLFTSSIGAAQSWKSSLMGLYPETLVLDPKYAVGGGYGESKYITERILAKSGLHASSLRIGQITGGNPNGAWAMSDWVPIIIKSSLSLGMLPDHSGSVSWVPTNTISRAILDIGFAEENPPMAINLVHPHPVPWSSLMESIRESLIIAKHLPYDALRMVSFHKWLQALETASASATLETLRDIPAAKIIEFLRTLGEFNEEAPETEVGGLSLATDHIQRISQQMRELEPIGSHEANLWVEYWVQHGI
ncbi:hypothetical protein BDP27DRAFT_1289576 [Rhodocollybia butyracea]|uniref:Acetyl-CoA synthetase-like protein n=1 Tax=Rhodocollybia butyracea TaxID=206335 RepID=A0A9P5UBG8_9AGAR|nr:hypothetical protein BDP27DRAFT_1289576 [Rhodocollybia butyracea]